MKKSRNFGFTLLELLIVVVIVGILASFALPQFSRFTRRARTSEAQVNIGALLTAEMIYYQENNVFTSVLGRLLVDVNQTNFAYVVQAAGDNTVGPVAVVATGAGTSAGILVTATLTNAGLRTFTNN